MIAAALRSSLRDALMIAERFSGKNVSLPVVGNVLLKSEGKSLLVQATNLESGIEITIPAKISREGSITVPPRVLSSLLSTLSDEKITLHEKQNSLILETDSSKTEIRGIAGREFPIMPTIKPQTRAVLENAILQRELSRVLPAISVSDFKPEISGALLRVKNKEFIVTGTDTFRLAEARIKKFESDSEFSHILPLRPLTELVKVSGAEGETEFLFGGGEVQMETDSVRLVSRLIGGRYPEYENLIPHEFSATIRVPREELLQAVRLSGVFQSKLHDVILSYRAGHLSLEITNPEVGSHRREIEAKVSGKPGRVAFNHRYLSDALEALAASEIALFVTDETRPALVRDESDPSFFTILMPIRIS